MPYRVELTRKAAEELRDLPQHVQKRVARWLDLLAVDPRCEGSKQLTGKRELRRVHVGKDYVIVYTVRDVDMLLLVVRLANRKDVYRGL